VLPIVQKWCLYYIFVNDIIHWCRHEISGVVTQVDADVKGFKVGDHVGVGTKVNSCRDCENCNSFLENHCSKGVYTFNGIDTMGLSQRGVTPLTL
jgi:D-arabinose 1-dehydrogenase-like Zn-dependent alcohol dehydrogenase